MTRKGFHPVLPQLLEEHHNAMESEFMSNTFLSLKILTKANPVLMTFDRHLITLGIRLLAMIVDMSTHVDISAGSRNQRKWAKEGVQDSDVWGWIYDDWSKGLYRGVWWLLQGGILRPLVKPASLAWSACKPTAAWVTQRERERERNGKWKVLKRAINWK